MGNILFVGVAGEEFCSLTNEQISLIDERVLKQGGELNENPCCKEGV